MLFNLDNPTQLIIGLLVKCIVIVAILPIHEFAHGLAARKLGDRTAEMLGRLTLNPAKHIDPLGALMMVLVGFGWAKPVPVNAANFKWKNKKAAMGIVAAAGPLSNILVAFVSIILYRIVWCFDLNPDTAYLVSYMFSLFIQLNMTLAVFNLLPLPNLDGSKILYVFLPDKWIYQIERYAYVGFGIIFLVLWFTPIGDLIGLLSTSLINGMFSLINTVFSWFGL